jgi:hypothetical protein
MNHKTVIAMDLYVHPSVILCYEARWVVPHPEYVPSDQNPRFHAQNTVYAIGLKSSQLLHLYIVLT